jgi:hypothetical protein
VAIFVAVVATVIIIVVVGGGVVSFFSRPQNIDRLRQKMLHSSELGRGNVFLEI